MSESHSYGKINIYFTPRAGDSVVINVTCGTIDMTGLSVRQDNLMINDFNRITSDSVSSAANGSPSAREKDLPLPHIDAQRLEDTFISAAEIWAPSGHEAEMAEKMKSEFKAMDIPGCTIETDDTSSKTGSDTGNVIVNIPPSGDAPADAKAVCFSFHLDRVPIRAAGVPDGEPVEIEKTPDGTIRSRSARTNIAADDRAGYAAVTEAIRAIMKSGFPHGRIQVIGFVNEEPGLFGARELDPKYLRNLDYGFELDGGKAGNVIRGAAGIHRFRAVIRGTSAPSIHSGQGKSALVAGADLVQRLSTPSEEPGQILNISNFQAGMMGDNGRPITNVVPDNAEISGEFRGRTPDDEKKLQARVDRALEEIAKAHGVETSSKYEATEGFQLSDSSPVVKFAAQATKAAGLKPNIITMMGGSDANHMNLKGLPTVVIGSGGFLQHTEREYTTRNALVNATRVVLSLIASAASPAVAAALTGAAS